MKKIISAVLYAVIICSGTAHAQQIRPQGSMKELFFGPVDKDSHDKWLDSVKIWRSNEKTRLNYNNSEYQRPELNWIKKTFIYAQMMAHDRYFYNEEKKVYTVDRYLDDLNKRYGGLDAVLIWPTYPNIGIDNRNQYDLVADMPGGTEAVREMIRDFKKRGVRVFFPIMIWDHGTKKIALPMAEALSKEMKELGADGLNGDTMFGVTELYKNAYMDLGYPLALQPELNIKELKALEWNLLSWGYYWQRSMNAPGYNYSPGASTYKWLEPRHQVHVTDRWAIDKTDNLHYAFFNGVGYNSWENIWGIWNQVPDRYAEAIRRIALIYRQFPDIWSSSDWEPHIPVIQKGVYASVFPAGNRTIYTFINRDSSDKTGKQIILPFSNGETYYDLWNGKELKAEKEGNWVHLSFPMESRGFGAILISTSNDDKKSLTPFLNQMNMLSKKLLTSFSADWKPLLQQITSIEKTKSMTKANNDMVLIPAAKEYNFESNGVMIEGNELPKAIGVQYPWEKHAGRSHKKTMEIASFYMDKYPVTNQQFKKFMDDTKYKPSDAHNFLKDWKNGTFPQSWEDKPVTWVSIEDARIYAAWAGKRLPHEWEWQYAAQGTDSRLYPWGNTMDSTMIPAADTSRAMREPYDVKIHTKAASQFGIMDLVGNVWQWTDEYIDDHTRSAILKGGSYYNAQTSKWYFPQAKELNKHAKYLLMSPSLDRARTIGFRCVSDL